jgi:hypothetical protein
MITWLTNDYAAHQYLALNSSFQALEELTGPGEYRELSGLEQEKVLREGDQKRRKQRVSGLGRWLRLGFHES